MHFLVSVQHKTSWLTYRILAEPDAIFIAHPQTLERPLESIFLLKTDNGWVGDAADKALVKQIGEKIEMQSGQSRTVKDKLKP